MWRAVWVGSSCRTVAGYAENESAAGSAKESRTGDAVAGRSGDRAHDYDRPPVPRDRTGCEYDRTRVSCDLRTDRTVER